MIAVACLAGNETEQGEFDSQGVQIHFATAGEGEAVVLIHGWMGDSRSWGSGPDGNTRLDASKTEGLRLIALDCRGHGKSDKPHDPALYGSEMAMDVVRLLDHLGIERAHLVGYSSGSFIAGWVAATHPERVRSIVFAGQAPLVSVEPLKPSREVEVFAQTVENDQSLGAYIQAVTPRDRPVPTPEQAEALARFMFHGKDIRALALAGRSFVELRVTPDQLRAFSAPMLFIHGSNESESVKAGVAAVRELLGASELKVVEGTDHMTTPRSPEFGASVRAFLQANREP
jgi:pimeloyl-ACP methyl ester carboxylesterase